MNFTITLDSSATTTFGHVPMEPKSGKLHKLGSGLFGPKWTEKWVHLDGTLLKCFPMAVQQQVFSLGSSRQSSTYELMDYKFAVADEKKLNRKFTFQLESVQKSSKVVTFACLSEKELVEWRLALQSRLCFSADTTVSPVIAEKIRRAAEMFSKVDIRNTGRIDFGKLREMLQTVGWEGKDSEFRLMQQQLGRGRQREITQTRFLAWLQSYYCGQEVTARMQLERLNNQTIVEVGQPPKNKTLDSSNARVLASKCVNSQRREDWDQTYKAFGYKNDITDIIGNGSKISAFFANFRQTAEQLVIKIVEEMAFNYADKTVQPQPLDGDDFFATDNVQHLRSLLPMILKYQCDGLLVYMCSNISADGEVYEKMQHAECVAVFHKLVGHQIRAARVVQKALEEFDDDTQPSRQDSILQVPLQCAVDHVGFRAFVIASSQPVLISTRQNLKSLMKNSDMQRLNVELKLVFDDLGLFTDSLHAQNDDQVTSHDMCPIPAYFPASAGFSVEAQEGVLAFKLQNLMDVIPADLSSDESDAIADTVLLHKMRPEFVRMHGNSLPLCSNAYLTINQQENCASSKSEVEKSLLQQSIKSAHECLQTIIIPEFVADLENGMVQVIDSRSLTRALHGEGINVRYLASCYKLTSLKHVRRALLAEMVARASKVEFRASLRAILFSKTTATILRQASKDGGEGNNKIDVTTARALAKMVLLQEVSQITVEFFNLVLGISSLDSRTFWNERLLPQMRDKFGTLGDELTWDSIVSEDMLHMPQLFHALQVQTGVCCMDHMSYNFKGISPIVRDCIQGINPRTKLLARSLAKCEKFIENADAFLAAKEFNSALSSIIFHISILETASSDVHNFSLCHLLTCAADILLAMNLLDKAEQSAVFAIEESCKNHAELARVYTLLMKLKHASSDLVGAQECFAKALQLIQWHLGPVHPLLCDTYMTMTEILCDLGKLEQAVEVMQNCVALVRDCFGKTSLLYADVRRQQGMLMFAANSTNAEAVIGILEDAYSVYEKHFHDPVEDVAVYKEFAAECCYVLASLQVQVNGGHAAEPAYEVSLAGLNLRKEVLSSSHEEIMKSYLQLGRLSQDLGEDYRAVEYFKPALSIMKVLHDDKHIDQIRSITQLMLQLHLQTLSQEKRNIVDKTAKRYAKQWPHFSALDALSDIVPTNDVGEEIALLTFVMKNLFHLEPIDYVDLLIEKTSLEFQEYRKQYNFNFAGTLHRSNTGAPSPQSALLHSPSGRFSSFSGSGTFSSPGSPRAPLSPMRHPTLFPPSPRSQSSFNQLDCSFLKSSTGDFTNGGQLAAVLFLIDYTTESII